MTKAHKTIDFICFHHKTGSTLTLQQQQKEKKKRKKEKDHKQPVSTEHTSQPPYLGLPQAAQVLNTKESKDKVQ